MKHSEFLFTNYAFGHLAANVRVRRRDFSKLRVYAVYSNRHQPSLFGEHCEILRWRTLRKTLKRWWGRKTAVTAGDERDGATGGVMYANEGPYTIDVRHLCLASIVKFCDGGL